MKNVVAQRIKSVLEDRQISISAFSKMIGMQQVNCNRQIRGDQTVSLGVTEEFLGQFEDISAEWLLRGKGSKFVEDEVTMVAEPEPTYRQVDNVSKQEESIWKAKYEAIKDCYGMLVSSLGGIMGKRSDG